MTSEEAQRGGHRRRLAGRATAAVSAQGIQAASSLALQILAARVLGPAGYGVYTIILGLLITMSALQAGLRDSAIVLEHHDATLHGPMLVAQYCALLVATGIAFTVGVAFDLTSLGGSALFAAMVGLWILEESGRRFLMARQRFWALVVNDVVYCAGAIGTVVAIRLLAGHLTLSSFLASMSVGSTLSFAVAYFQLPRGTFRIGSFTWSGLRTVLSFAAWRSGQGLVRPLSITLVRVSVAGFASTATLGRVEATRLLIAPAQVFANGIGTFLLPHFIRNLPRDRREVTRLLRLPTVVMALGTGTVGLLAVVFAEPLQRLLAGDRYPTDVTATLGWALFAVAFSAGVPAGALALARRESLRVFLNRAIDAGVGVLSAVALVLVTNASGAPYGLALGATVGGVLLWIFAYRAPVRGADPMTAADDAPAAAALAAGVT